MADDDHPGDVPSMSADIDAYIKEAKESIARVEKQQSQGLRTTDFTFTDFSETKRDRQWKMKQQGEMIDTILITADGRREPVHMDIILELGAKEAFFGEEKPSSESKYVKEYTVKEDIFGSVLAQLIHFAYMRKLCQLEKEEEMVALTKTAFSYGLSSLMENLIAFMKKHCLDISSIKGLSAIVYSAYEKAMTYNNSSNSNSISSSISSISSSSSTASSSLVSIEGKPAQVVLQQFIEDHFEEFYRSPSQKEDLLRLSYPLLSTILRWDRLSVRSEETIWWVIHDWVAYEPDSRLPHLFSLLTGGCLRLGRLSSAFLQQSVLGGDLFRAQNEDSQARGKAAVKEVLEAGLADHSSAAAPPLTKDGHGLWYSKEVTTFCPRVTRQLLVMAGGEVCGKNIPLIVVFDYQTNRWLDVTLRLSRAVREFGLKMVGSVLYVFGGITPHREDLCTMTACDLSKPLVAAPATAAADSQNAAQSGQWERKANMLGRRSYLASTVLDGLIYAIGGARDADALNSCERYDPATDQWTAIAELNYPRTGASAFSHDGRIFVCGGVIHNGSDRNHWSSVEVYCPALGDRWLLLTSTNASPRSWHSLAFFGERIWAVGGQSHLPMNKCESLDLATGVWRAEAPTVRDRVFCKVIPFRGELYAIGGCFGKDPYFTTVEKYSPETGRWTEVAFLPHFCLGMSVLVLPNNTFPALTI